MRCVELDRFLDPYGVVERTAPRKSCPYVRRSPPASRRNLYQIRSTKYDLDIEVTHRQRVLLDEAPARLHLIPYQLAEDVVRIARILHLHLQRSVRLSGFMVSQSWSGFISDLSA